MEFFHSLPIPEIWEWIFLFPSRSRISGMGFFNSLSLPESSKAIPAHPCLRPLQRLLQTSTLLFQKLLKYRIIQVEIFEIAISFGKISGGHLGAESWRLADCFITDVYTRPRQDQVLPPPSSWPYSPPPLPRPLSTSPSTAQLSGAAPSPSVRPAPSSPQHSSASYIFS